MAYRASVDGAGVPAAHTLKAETVIHTLGRRALGVWFPPASPDVTELEIGD